jgi:long-chain fatty acid transport protein
MTKFLPKLLICLPLFANAQGYQVALQGQAQQGLASAGTALHEDGAWVYYNPGAGAFYNKREVNLGFSPVFSNVLYQDRNSNSISRTESPVGTPFSLYGVWQRKEDSKLKFGLGIYTPFGSTIQYEKGWIGRFAITRLALKAIYLQPTVSYKINKYFGVGAGFVYAVGSVNLQKDIPVIDSLGFTSDQYSSVELDGKAKGTGFNIGVMIKPIEKLNIGIVYKSQTDMKIASGDATFKVPATLAANFPSGKFKSQLPLPQILSIGLAYDLTEKTKISAEVNFVGWKAYDTLRFDYEVNTASLVDTKSARNYNNGYSIRCGVQHKVNDKFTLRFGLAYGVAPAPDGYVTPETPDANRFNLTTGIGYKAGKKFVLNASFLYTQIRRVDTNIETGLSGIFTTKVLAPGFGVAYQF